MSQLIQSFELPRRRSEMSFEHIDESQLVQLEKQVQMLMVSVTVDIIDVAVINEY